MVPSNRHTVIPCQRDDMGQFLLQDRTVSPEPTGAVTVHQGLLLLFPKGKMARRKMRGAPQSRAKQQNWTPRTTRWTGVTSSDSLASG